MYGGVITIFLIRMPCWQKIEYSYRWDDILFRVLPNIFVVVVFISLAIRIVMFNFKDGIFEIFGGKQ